MTSIYRTAYPHFHKDRKIALPELTAYYSLTNDELAYVKKNVRGDSLRLGFSVQLKVFQKFGYFPVIESIPQNVVEYIKLTFRNKLMNKIPNNVFQDNPV